MKKQLIFTAIFLVLSTTLVVADNFIASFRLDFAETGTSVSAAKVASSDYDVINTAELKGRPEEEMVAKLGVDLGWEWNELSLFGRFNIATINNSSYLLDRSLSASYYSTSGTGGTYTAWDKVRFGFYEFSGSINVKYDYLIIGEGEAAEDFSLGIFGGAGAGAAMAFGIQAGAYEVEDWPDTYTGDGSPSASYNQQSAYDGLVSTIVPFATVEAGLSFYLSSSNPWTVSAGVDIYPMSRFTGTYNAQDTDGNALAVSYSEHLFRFKGTVGYTLKF